MRINASKSALMLFVGLTLLLLGSTGNAQNGLKDRWNAHKNADPLVISGSLGSSLSDQWSNNQYSSSPFAFAAYANLNFNVYGFNIPLNFNFLDVSLNNIWNDLKSSFPAPTISLGITPQLGKWRFHAGFSSMAFSNYVYSGMQFIGGGIEYIGTFHFATFVGLLNRPTKYRELDTRSAFQQYTDSLLGLNTYETQRPQFRRNAIGAKLGIGSSRNYLDIMFLKAKDDMSSLPLMIPSADSTIHRDSLVVPKENLAIGAQGRISIGDHFTISANGAASVFTPNIAIDSIDVDGILDFLGTDENVAKTITDIYNKASRVMPLHANTQIRFAGDVSANLGFKAFNLGGQYRMIQSEYTSLGVYSTQQNLQSLALTSGLNLFKGRFSLNASGYSQQDNLDGQQLFTNLVSTYNLNINTIFSQNFSLALMGNMILQEQNDGMITVDPSMRIDQTTINATGTPTYTFSSIYDHNISLNLSYIATQNNNTQLISNIDSKTSTIGASYELDMQDKGLSFNGSYDFSKSFSSYSNYASNTFGVGCRYSILKGDVHTLSLNGNGSLGINNIFDQGDPDDVFSMEERMGTAKNTSYQVVTMKAISFDLSCALSWYSKKGHSATFRATLRNYSNRELIAQKVATTLNANLSLSYTYSFSKRVIKKKDSNEDSPQLTEK